MKKLLFLIASFAVSCVAMAEWGTNADNPVRLFPAGTSSYATETALCEDGGVWAIIYHPNLSHASGEDDIDNVIYEYRLQYFDPSGNPQFPQEGILISDYKNWSYTVVNHYIFPDKEGNVIVIANDCRNSSDRGKSATVYKVNRNGEQLWGEDGISLTNPAKPSDSVVCQNMVQFEDGSYVFAWVQTDGDNDRHIYMQRLDRDGNALWELGKVGVFDQISQYPYLINSGENTCILVYAGTVSKNIYARKIDFEGESVWGKDTRIYRGGWGLIPLHVVLDVVPSGDGGVVVGWYDDRDGDSFESPYISYVRPDGSLGFTGTSDEGDCKLAYLPWRCIDTSVVPAKDGSGFYAIWRVLTESTQKVQGIIMQKVSKTGDLLWGDEGKFIIEPRVGYLSYFSLQPTDDNGACLFYQGYSDYNSQSCLAYRFDSEGNAVYNTGDGTIRIAPADVASSNLATKLYPDGQSVLCTWDQDGVDEIPLSYMMTKYNLDGTFGNSQGAVDGIISGSVGFLSYDGGCIYADLTDGTVIDVCDVAGSHMMHVRICDGKAVLDLSKGLYIASVSGTGAIKFVVR